MTQKNKELLRVLTPQELAQIYQEEMTDTFPPNELKPLSSMEGMRELGRYEPLGLFDENGELEGYALFWTDEMGEYPLLDYLGVPAAKRGGGIGARLLALVGEHFARAKGIIVEAEAEESGDPAERDLRRRRLGFYRRCGFAMLPYDCALFGVHYKVLLLSRGPIDAQEAMERHRGLYQNQFAPERFARYVQFPLKEGEKIREFAPWKEK